MSTHTERCVSRKSSGRYGHGMRLNQVNFIAAACQHLVDLEMEIREAREIDGHELAARVATHHRGRDRVALEDVLLVEQLGVPLQVVLVPRLDVFAYSLEIVLGRHGPPSGLSHRFRTSTSRCGAATVDQRACAVNGPRAAAAATGAGWRIFMAVTGSSRIMVVGVSELLPNGRGSMTKAQRRLRTRKRKADMGVAKAKRMVQALTKKLRGATKTLTKRQATRKKIG